MGLGVVLDVARWKYAVRFYCGVRGCACFVTFVLGFCCAMWWPCVDINIFSAISSVCVPFRCP